MRTELIPTLLFLKLVFSDVLEIQLLELARPTTQTLDISIP